ncbi:PHO85 cyclin-1 [Coemansia erecta]|uniref:PHO85 cyclin-1 n=1 Tax=Coemansia erecta TaxID=147472 RepID=A0A9W7Y4M9_9FUNG|nr:PHO85 cyclin-1 [Coemansia erecta]
MTVVGARPAPVVHPLQSLYHIPSTLTTFTVEYLSKLFSAVDRPNSTLKLPSRQPDNRKFPEFRYFVRTLLINGRISADTLVHALIYLSRFHRRAFKKSAVVEEGAKHKLFLAALLVASKFCDDRYPLATISVCEFLPRGLLSLEEVNRMERAFLRVIGFKLIVDPDELALLLSRHGIDIKQIAQTIAQRLGGAGVIASGESRANGLKIVPPPRQQQQQPQIQQQQQQPSVAALVTGGIPQRAQAGHSTSARTGRSGSFGLIGVSAPLSASSGVATLGTARLTAGMPVQLSQAQLQQFSGTVVLHNAHLETASSTSAKRPAARRNSKPLPSIDRYTRQREPLELETMFKQPISPPPPYTQQGK